MIMFELLRLRNDIDYMWQEKKREAVSFALKITIIQGHDLYAKISQKDCLQQPVTAIVTEIT